MIADWQTHVLDNSPNQGLGECIVRAIERFFAADSLLLVNNLNERTITGQFAVHLRPEFNRWDVDCEYNRDGHLVKKANGEIVVPDIIVHHRGTADNLLVIEVKKSNSRVRDEEDLSKLGNFLNSDLQYRHGLFLKFAVGKRAPGLTRVQWV